MPDEEIDRVAPAVEHAVGEEPHCGRKCPKNKFFVVRRGLPVKSRAFPRISVVAVAVTIRRNKAESRR